MIPNPLDQNSEALVFYQNINDIRNLKLNNEVEAEYNEIRFKVMNFDLEKEKKFIIGCLK